MDPIKPTPPVTLLMALRKLGRGGRTFGGMNEVGTQLLDAKTPASLREELRALVKDVNPDDWHEVDAVQLSMLRCILQGDFDGQVSEAGLSDMVSAIGSTIQKDPRLQEMVKKAILHLRSKGA